MDQWRSVLTPDQIRGIVDTHRVQMERFGYIPAEYRKEQAS